MRCEGITVLECVLGHNIPPRGNVDPAKTYISDWLDGNSLCLPGRIHKTFSLETSLTSPPGDPEEEYYRDLGYGGDIIGVNTRDWYLMSNSNSPLTGGRNTHTIHKTHRGTINL